MCFFLDDFKFLVEFIDFGVAVVNFLSGHLLIVGERQLAKEFLAEILGLETELIKSFLDHDGLLSLKREDIGLDLEDPLGSLVELRECIIDALKRVLLALLHDLDTVLLELIDHLLHADDDAFALRLHVLEVADDAHDLHEQLLLALVLLVCWVVLDTIVGFVDELFQVLECRLELHHQELSVHLDPASHLILQARLQRLDVDSQPCDLHWCLDLHNLALDGLQVSDLIIE